MTLYGWISLIVACGGFTALLAWCIYKVIATPDSTKHLHAQTDIDPHDQN